MEYRILPLRREYAWAVPTQEALDTIKEFSPNGVVEIGAGTGYWASLLQQRGVNVIAYDKFPTHCSELNPYHWVGDRWMNAVPFTLVLSGGPDSCSGHTCAARSLLLCFPPKETDEGDNDDKEDGDDDDDDGIAQEGKEKNKNTKAPKVINTMGVDAVKSYQGECVIYVGEWKGQTSRMCVYGETSGALLQKELSDHFTLARVVKLPTWPFASDNLQVWRRRTSECNKKLM
uniref:Uncharacterized protein n=1 Tax=Lotharella oceanica TaxID=641309 RepID=A0A7S2TMA9_9EUKA|mmetsp:Transcript_2081/g.3992  ORF Transcript_2081/g.3992 Transcript_2081/m.3992 type:complete len:231 (+) Transcript_2081:45-737(+)